MFNSVEFLNESRVSSIPSQSVRDIEARIVSEGVFMRDTDVRIGDCSVFISEAMIMECLGNEDLIRQACLLEGAKFDYTLQNLFKEGKDYKNLRKEVRDIVKANDLDDSELKSKGKGFMHVCKRILQITEDIAVFSGVGSLASVLVTGNPFMILGGIIGFVIGFIINRLFRYCWDSIEFETIKSDAEDVVKDLRKMANKVEDEKLQKKYNDEADRLEEAIDKYSKKRD